MPQTIRRKPFAFTPRYCELMKVDADIKGLGGGKGGSKTYGVVLECMLKAAHKPGLRVAYIRRDWSHSEEVRDELRRMLNDYLTEYDEQGDVVARAADLIGDEVRFKNGSKFLLLNCHDQASAQKLHGKSYAIYIFDEMGQIPPGLIEFVRLGKRTKRELNVRSQEFYISNPEGESVGDFIDMFGIDGTVCAIPGARLVGERLWVWEREVVQPDGRITVIKYAYQHTTYLDNPFIDQDQYYATAFATINDDNLRRRMMLGDFNALSGKVLRSFNPAIHVYDPEADGEYISDSATFIAGGDWGDNAPAVFLLATLDVNNEMRIVGELCDVFDTSGAFAEAVQGRLVRDYTGLYTWLTWLDVPCAMDYQIFAAGKGWEAGQSTGTRLRDDYGFTFVPTSKYIEPAIQILRDLFGINPATNRPYLRISKRCPGVVEDIQRWVYDEKGKPAKANELHRLAALRYLVASYHAKHFPRITRETDPKKGLRKMIEQNDYTKEQTLNAWQRQEAVVQPLGRHYTGRRKIEGY